MSGTLSETPFDLTEAVRNLVTEDDEPVDNILSEKQQRLLVDALYDNWTPPPAEDGDEAAPGQPRRFWVGADVGIFHSVHLPGIAPDVFLSLDVTAPADLRAGDLIEEAVSRSLASREIDWGEVEPAVPGVRAAIAWPDGD